MALAKRWFAWRKGVHVPKVRQRVLKIAHNFPFMNSLLVLPKECTPDQRIVISGKRVSYIHDWHDLTVGQIQKVLLYQDSVGYAKVTRVEKEEIELILESSGEPPPSRIPLSLVIATPRPQTVKKVLETAASIGVSKLSFIRSNKVIKSYLSSRVLEHEQIWMHLCRGMEQACDPFSPEVEIHNGTLPSFCKTHVAQSQGLSVVADTSAPLHATLRKALQTQDGTRPVRLFIGPEAGWEEGEVDYMSTNGITPVSLGDRMLRVETALAVAYGEIKALL